MEDIFWILNTKYNRIYKCHNINEKQYKIIIVFDLNFKILDIRDIVTFNYEYDDIGTGRGNIIANDSDSKIFTEQELKNYLLLQKL
jgi:hypothetical protein